jgi:hypothetical protein
MRVFRPLSRQPWFPTRHAVHFGSSGLPTPDLNLSLAMHEELQLRIASDCKVLIQFKGIATQSAIRKLITYLEMALGDFPKNSDKSATQE